MGYGSTSGGALPEDCPRVKVTVVPGNTLNVRPTPSTAGEPVDALASGAIVDAVALVHGESIDGSDLWFEIASDELAGFVLGSLVACTTEEPPVLIVVAMGRSRIRSRVDVRTSCPLSPQ